MVISQQPAIYAGKSRCLNAQKLVFNDKLMAFFLGHYSLVKKEKRAYPSI